MPEPTVTFALVTPDAAKGQTPKTSAMNAAPGVVAALDYHAQTMRASFLPRDRSIRDHRNALENVADDLAAAAAAFPASTVDVSKADAATVKALAAMLSPKTYEGKKYDATRAVILAAVGKVTPTK